MGGCCVAGMAWGNGFTVNQTLIRQYNLSDPSGFFEDITAVPTLASRTILSVHVYGPNITVSNPLDAPLHPNRRHHGDITSRKRFSGQVLHRGEASSPHRTRRQLHAACSFARQEWLGGGLAYADPTLDVLSFASCRT